MAERCKTCGWPLKSSVEEGCTADSCSMRPLPVSEMGVAGALMLNEVVGRLTAERDALRACCRDLVAAMVAYEMDVEADAPPAHRAMMERAQLLLAPAERTEAR